MLKILLSGHLWRNSYAAKICFGLYVPLIIVVLLKTYIKPTPERKKTTVFRVWTFCANLLPFVALIIGGHVAWRMKHDDHYTDSNADYVHDFEKYVYVKL